MFDLLALALNLHDSAAQSVPQSLHSCLPGGVEPNMQQCSIAQNKDHSSNHMK